MLRTLLLLIALFIIGSFVSPAPAQTPPAIISFTSDLDTITVAEAEAGTHTVTLSWSTYGMTDDHDLVLHMRGIGSWVFLLDEGEQLPTNGSYSVTVSHPLNFHPPTFRLAITDRDRISIITEQTLTIPYAELSSDTVPSIESFTTTTTSVTADELVYERVQIPVSWETVNRPATANLIFEQVMPDGSVSNIELPRDTLWVSSNGQGTLNPEYRANSVQIRLRMVDLVDNRTLDEASLNITVTGVPSTPTPTPPPVVDSGGSTSGGTSGSNPPPPVVNPGAGGTFELGGHVMGYGHTNEMRSAGMTWAKVQIRWNLGEGTGAAANAINAAHANGFRILLGIVGYSNQMSDYNAYTDAFAAYLGQVAALGPDAIEVWNEPNLAREWPAGSINGSNYIQMLSKAYNAIKSTNPNVMVISAALAPTGFFGGCATNGCDDNVFLRQMANAGAVNYMDCIGAHYNEGIIGPDQRSGDPRSEHYSRYFYGTLDLYYNTFGGSRRVCWTELGYLSGEGYPPLPPNFAWAGNTTLGQHAEWLGRATTLSRSSGRVRLMIVWNVDFTVYNDDPQAGYAIVRPDGSCPACATLSAAMR